MEQRVVAFFERYAELFELALRDPEDLDELSSVYAAEMIAAFPGGVAAAKNDDDLKAVMANGYKRYRAIGTKEMRIQDISIEWIDDLHCVANVHWMSVYERENVPDVEIEFDVHYLVQLLNDEPKIFGWVSGDEQALLREKGIV